MNHHICALQLEHLRKSRAKSLQCQIKSYANTSKSQSKSHVADPKVTRVPCHWKIALASVALDNTAVLNWPEKLTL